MFKRKPKPDARFIELMAAVESADVWFRSGTNEDGSPRILVRLPGAAFYYTGQAHAEQLLARRFDVPRKQAKKGARLLAKVITQRAKLRESQEVVTRRYSVHQW